MEEWKDIEGFEGYYMVSNYGNVISLDRKIIRSDGRTQTIERKNLTVTHYSNGYCRVGLSKDGETKDFLLNRLVAKAFVSNDDPISKIEVNHKDGNKDNNQHENLEWCTSSENKKHAFSTGLSKQKLGESNQFSKLTNEQVLEIRKLYEIGGYTQRKLAEMFNVGKTTIYEVLNRKTRKLI